MKPIFKNNLNSKINLFINLNNKKKNKIKNFLNKKFNFNDDLDNYKSLHIKTIIFKKKNNFNFYSNYLFYKIYQKTSIILKSKFNNIKYLNNIEIIKEKNTFLKFRNKDIYFYFIKKKISNIITFLSLYLFFFNTIYLDIFCLIKNMKKKNKSLFFLVMSFKKNKLFLNLLNFSKRNFLNLSSGLFIKFFEKRKAFKKNKTIKILMAKYFRKLFIILKIKNLALIIKKIPASLSEILTFLNSPIVHKFLNPIENKIIEENEKNPLFINFLYFLFLENKNFSKNKIAQKGRIKRKILRKLTFDNKIID